MSEDGPEQRNLLPAVRPPPADDYVITSLTFISEMRFSEMRSVKCDSDNE